MRVFEDWEFSLSGKLLIMTLLLGLVSGCVWLLLKMAVVVVLSFILVFNYPFRSLYYYINKALFVTRKVSVSVGRPQLRRTFSDYLNSCVQTPRASGSKEKRGHTGFGTQGDGFKFTVPTLTTRQFRVQRLVHQIFRFRSEHSDLFNLVSSEIKESFDGYLNRKEELLNALKEKKIEDLLKAEAKFFEHSSEAFENMLNSSDSTIDAAVRQLICDILQSLKGDFLRFDVSTRTIGSSGRSAFDSVSSDLNTLNSKNRTGHYSDSTRSEISPGLQI